MAYAACPAGTLPSWTFGLPPNRRRSIAGPFLGRGLLHARHDALQLRDAAAVLRALCRPRIVDVSPVVGVETRIVVAVVAIFVEGVLGEVDLFDHDTDAIYRSQQSRHRRGHDVARVLAQWTMKIV